MAKKIISTETRSYLAKENIDHNGELYRTDDQIELTQTEADALGKAVSPIENEPKKESK